MHSNKNLNLLSQGNYSVFPCITLTLNLITSHSSVGVGLCVGV